MKIDHDKNPIGYRVFKTYTYEGNILKEALEDVKKISDRLSYCSGRYRDTLYEYIGENI